MLQSKALSHFHCLHIVCHKGLQKSNRNYGKTEVLSIDQEAEQRAACRSKKKEDTENICRFPSFTLRKNPCRTQ